MKKKDRLKIKWLSDKQKHFSLPGSCKEYMNWKKILKK